MKTKMAEHIIDTVCNGTRSIRFFCATFAIYFLVSMWLMKTALAGLFHKLQAIITDVILDHAAQ